MPKIRILNQGAMFEKAAGHPMDTPKRVVICRGPDKFTVRKQYEQ